MARESRGGRAQACIPMTHGWYLTALVILSVLSTCQACCHRMLWSGRRRQLPSVADNRQLCEKRRKLRSFSVLLWRDLWLQADISAGSGDSVLYKPVLQAPACVCHGVTHLSWRSLEAGGPVGLYSGPVWFLSFPLSSL